MVKAGPLLLPTTYSPGPGVLSFSAVLRWKRFELPMENLGPVAAGPLTEYAAGPGEFAALAFSLRRERMLYFGPLFSLDVTA